MSTDSGQSTFSRIQAALGLPSREATRVSRVAQRGAQWRVARSDALDGPWS